MIRRNSADAIGMKMNLFFFFFFYRSSSWGGWNVRMPESIGSFSSSFSSLEDLWMEKLNECLPCNRTSSPQQQQQQTTFQKSLFQQHTLNSLPLPPYSSSIDD